MSPIVDFSDVKGLEPVPSGQYLAVIEAATDGLSKAGLPKTDLRWNVQTGEFTDRKIFQTISWAPKALWRAKQTLDALGMSTSGEQEITAEDFLGRTAMLTVAVEHSGEVDPETGDPYPDRNVVKRIRPAETSVSDYLR